MLIRFVVSNFMSFKDETEFNMLPSKGNGSRKLKNHIHKTNSGIEVLKTAAIYGANAAGKSNLIKAIEYLKDVIFERETLLVPQSKRFRIDRSYNDKPTTFRIEYEYKGYHFDYAIEIAKGKIQQEWLYLINSIKNENEQLLYKRENQTVTFGDYFNDSKDLSYIKTFLKKELSNTETVLNACYENIEDIDIIDIVFRAFMNLCIVMPNSKNSHYSPAILAGHKSIEFAEKLLTNGKTGIENLIVKEIEANTFFSYADEDLKKEYIDELESLIEFVTNEIEGFEIEGFEIDDFDIENDIEKLYITFEYKSQLNILSKKDGVYNVSLLKSKHYNSENLFDFDEESDGTNRLFELTPAFEHLILEGNVVYIIDELERSMHPLLAKELLKMYSSSKTSNSQLIFTTHESHLLDNELLRNDEIWFTEKRSDGSTEFYPLSDFNPRGDKVLERGYLEGRYGGIPYLGDFSKLINTEAID